MSWIATAHNRRFDFSNLNPDAICLEDIAHSLSQTCRFNGMCNRFYSVARHSYNMALYAQGRGDDPVIVKQCLLHDASEAYMGDMVSPLKELFPEFKKLEKNIQAMVYEKYGLPSETLPEVKDLDLRIMVLEKIKLFDDKAPKWELEDYVEPLGMEIKTYPSPYEVGKTAEVIIRLDGLHKNYIEIPTQTKQEWLRAARDLLNG